MVRNANKIRFLRTFQPSYNIIKSQPVGTQVSDGLLHYRKYSALSGDIRMVKSLFERFGKVKEKLFGVASSCYFSPQAHLSNDGLHA